MAKRNPRLKPTKEKHVRPKLSRFKARKEMIEFISLKRCTSCKHFASVHQTPDASQFGTAHCLRPGCFCERLEVERSGEVS
jgi:hypothetical protein